MFILIKSNYGFKSHCCQRWFRRNVGRSIVGKSSILKLKSTKALEQHFAEKTLADNLKNKDATKKFDTVGRKLFSSVLFAISFSGTCFIITTIWSAENRKNLKEQMLKAENWKFIDDPKRPKSPIEAAKFVWNERIKLDHRVVLGIAALNFLLCFSWRKIATTQSFMLRYFTCNLLTKNFRPSSIVLSSVSHQNLLPLFFNLYLFMQIGLVASEEMGAERFTSFFVSSAAFANVFGLMVNAIAKKSRAYLGLSAVTYACIAYYLRLYSYGKWKASFLPDNVSISSQEILSAILICQTSALTYCTLFAKVPCYIFHPAHLGGTLFGWWYAKHGSKALTKYANKIEHIWLSSTNK